MNVPGSDSRARTIPGKSASSSYEEVRYEQVRVFFIRGGVI